VKDRLRLEIEKETDDKGSKIGISVSFDAKSGEGLDQRKSDLLIGKCNSYKELEEEVSKIKEELDALLAKAKPLFGSEMDENEVSNVNEDMSAEKIWDILSGIKDFEILLLKFNGISYEKRLEIADYVFTHGNIFSGHASDFSARYNSEKGILE
jgi:hypothetical protein